MKKIIILFAAAIFSILLVSSVSAEFWTCFDKGQKIVYCNKYANYYRCGNYNGCTTSHHVELCMSNYDEIKKCYNQGNWNLCESRSKKECSAFGDNYSIDSEIPIINVNNPLEGKWYNSRSILTDINLSEKADLYFLDNIFGRNRWSRICEYCDGNSKKRSFREGFNNLTFRAIDLHDQKSEIIRTFFIDSQKPVTHTTEPRDEYANGEFEIQYTEINLKNIKISYGNNETGFKTETLKNCSSGIKHWCSVNVNLNRYNGERIKYWFTLEDLAGNTKDSQVRQNLRVDTIYPKLNNPGSFFDYTSGNRYAYFRFNITEANLDKIEYIDYSEKRPSWKTLCSKLKNGICEIKKSFTIGNHNVDIQITDKAGNAIGRNVKFNVIY